MLSLKMTEFDEKFEVRNTVGLSLVQLAGILQASSMAHRN